LGVNEELTTPYRKKKARYDVTQNFAGFCEYGNEPSGSLKGGELAE